MALATATEPKSISDIISNLIDFDLVVKNVELAAAGGSEEELEPGEVLGKITSTGVYRRMALSGTSGAEIADAALLDSVTVPAAGSITVRVLFRGPVSVFKEDLTFVGTVTQPQKDAAFAALEAKGIRVRAR